MKKWQVISNDGYKGQVHITQLAAELDMHKSNIFEIEENMSRRWHVEAVEEPEPVDLERYARLAWIAWNGPDKFIVPYCKDADRWERCTAAVIAAAPPRELTDEQIGDGIQAVFATLGITGDVYPRHAAAFRVAVALASEGKK